MIICKRDKIRGSESLSSLLKPIYLIFLGLRLSSQSHPRILHFSQDDEGLLASLPSPEPKNFYTVDKVKADLPIDSDEYLVMDTEEYLQPKSLNNLEHRQTHHDFLPRVSQ